MVRRERVGVTGVGMPVPSRGTSICRDHMQRVRGATDDGRFNRGCGGGWEWWMMVTATLGVARVELEIVRAFIIWAVCLEVP